jgi:nucleolar complex protein 3
MNIDFFCDLIEVLHSLLVEYELGYREQIHCIKTMFVILTGQGEVLNIDPARFYTHLYKNMLNVHAGKNYDDIESIIETLDIVLIKRRKTITHHRFLAFMKRLMTMCLQVLPNGGLGLLGIVRNSMLVSLFFFKIILR